MIDYKRAILLVKQAHRERTITAVCDYDKNNYIVTALLNPSRDGEADPFYAVNKQTGVVTPFSASDDIQKFSEAMSKRLVYLAKG